MPLHDSVKTIEENIGQFSGYMCEFSGEQIAGEAVPLEEKPAYQFLLGIGADIKTIDTPLPKLLENPQLNANIAVNGVEVISQTRVERLKRSAKIYLNPEMITPEQYSEALKKDLTPQTRETMDGIALQNLSVGICHAQEIDLLVDHKLIEGKAFSSERTEKISDDAIPILLLSSPALNFSYGLAKQLTPEQQNRFILGMFRNLFNATVQEGRTHIALPAAGLGVFGGNPTVYFNALMQVSKQYPLLNIIYHPAQFADQFDALYLTNGSPKNVVRAQKDVIFIADALCKQGIPCAFHNPSDADVVLGIYGPGEYWQDGRGNRYVGEEHIGAMTTAPLGGRGINPLAYTNINYIPMPEADRSHCFFSTNTSDTISLVIIGLAGVVTWAAVWALSSSSIAMVGLVCAALLLIAGIVELIKHYNASGQSHHMAAP